MFFMNTSRVQALVKLQRPLPVMSNFLPKYALSNTFSEASVFSERFCSNITTFAPDSAAMQPHMSPAAPPPTMQSESERFSSGFFVNIVFIPDLFKLT